MVFQTKQIPKNVFRFICVMLALPQQFESMFALRILVGDDFFCSFVSCLLDYVFMFRELTRSL